MAAQSNSKCLSKEQGQLVNLNSTGHQGNVVTPQKGHNFAVCLTTVTHKHVLTRTHTHTTTQHSTGVRVHGLTEGTKSHWREGKEEERK